MRFSGGSKSAFRQLYNNANIKLDVQQENVVTVALLRYLFHADDFATLRTRLEKQTDLTGPQIRALRTYMVSFYPVSGALKHCLLLGIARQMNNEAPRMRNLLARAKLSSDDYAVWRAIPSMGIRPMLVRSVMDLPQTAIQPPGYWRERCDEMLEELQEPIRRFAGRKLKFIVESNGLNTKDFVGDLSAKAVEAFMRFAPHRDGAHLKNSVLRATYNYGQSIIKHFTTQKRGRVRRDGEGFQYVVRSYDVQTVGGSVEDSSVMMGVAPDEYASTEFSLTLESMSRNLAKPERNALCCLALTEDPTFDKYLAKHTRYSDAATALTKLGLEEYLKLVAAYTQVPMAQVKHLSQQLIIQARL